MLIWFVIIYWVVSVGIGLWAALRVKNTADFAAAGHSLQQRPTAAAAGFSQQQLPAAARRSSCSLHSNTLGSWGVWNRDKRAASTTAAGHAPRDAGQQKEKGGTVTNCYTLYAWRDTADGRIERQHAHRTPVATPWRHEWRPHHNPQQTNASLPSSTHAHTMVPASS